MGYIGNQTSNSYTSLAKQTITGDGGASYTLDHAVANEQEIEVFVNNVRQEPSVAYTVSGTALTMTGNVAASDDFYVVFQGKAIQTTSHPEGHDLKARDGTFSGDLTVDTDTLYVDSTNNRVGIGTTSPDAMLHLETANSPRLRLEDTTNSVKTDIFVGNSSSIIGNQSSHDLAFMTNDTERMRIDSSGNLMVGKTSLGVDTAGFEVRPDGETGIARSGGSVLDLNRKGSDGTIVLIRNDDTSVGSISVSGSATAYNTSSDHRLKENVEDMTGAITRVKNLQPKRFSWIVDDEDSANVDGFLAHEAQSVVPESVTGTHNEVDADGNPVYQGIDQAKLVPLLTGALQEAIAKIEALETRVQALEDA